MMSDLIIFWNAYQFALQALFGSEYTVEFLTQQEWEDQLIGQ